jgi:hypothetical protein
VLADDRNPDAGADNDGVVADDVGRAQGFDAISGALSRLAVNRR